MTGMDLFFAIFAGVVPSILWLIFWNREDADQPEPRSLLASCFFGGMVAVLVAIAAEQFVSGFGAVAASQDLKYTLWAAIEELLKFSVIAAIALHTRFYDEPIDAMIYSIAAALGFAALENALFIIHPLSTGDFAAGLVTSNMRFMGATLVHVVSSSLIGYGLAFAFYLKPFAKVVSWAIGLAAAVTLHAYFNISILNAGPLDTLKAFAWVWGAVVIMIVLFEEVKSVKPHFDREILGDEAAAAAPAWVPKRTE